MLVFGHRGAHAKGIAENTLEAFEEAVRQGADGIEFDIRVSKDGELVVIHDANLHRVAGDAHHISELTLQELQNIPLRHGGRIPSLSEVTSCIYTPTLFDIELKQIEAVDALIRKLNTSAALRERTIVSSFQTAILERLRQELPDVRRLLLIRHWPLPFRSGTLRRSIHQLQPWGIAARLLVLTRRRVRYLKRFGVFIGTWDLRGFPREARAAHQLGVDFAIVKCVREARAAARNASPLLYF